MSNFNEPSIAWFSFEHLHELWLSYGPKRLFQTFIDFGIKLSPFEPFNVTRFLEFFIS